MSEEKQDSDKETLTVNRPKKLQLTKTVESGKVKQNFTHGRSKTVTVEVRKTRTFTRKSSGETVKEETKSKDEPKITAPEVTVVRDKAQIQKATREVKAAKDSEARKSSRNEITSAPVKAPKEQLTAPKADAAARAPRGVDVDFPLSPEEEEARNKAKKEKAGAKTNKIRLKRDESRRSSGKLTVAQALEYQEERMRSLASIKRQREKIKRAEQGLDEPKDKIVREVIVPETITVQELANRMAERSTDVIKELMKLGTMAAQNQSIDADTAELIIEEFGHRIRRVTDSDVENILIEVPEDESNLKPRAPVVTVMGHVDHGKTSLLDALRKSDVVAGEAGGITQHIGAYQIDCGGDHKITFIDTPGHEAFTAMRARGAKVTDVVILVVAADDGIKTQTEEAIAHAKAAEVPIIVAINKIDKPEADPGRVKNELMQFELVPEEFGGDIQVVEVSAIAKTGLDTLAEAVLLQAEILDLKANPDRNAAGIVVEAQVDKGRGTVATLLVQRGTLKVGDVVVAGAAWGRVRAMHDDKGQPVEGAIPSQPVEVLGLGDAPMAGDEFAIVENEKTARDITEYRQGADRKKGVVTAKSLDQMFAEVGSAKVKELPLVIKGDVQGSVEAIIGSLTKFDSDEVKVRVLHSGVGGINESDIGLASATGAIVVGFNVRATSKAREMADADSIDIRYYSVIYDLVDDVKDALSGLLSPERRENLIGYAEIRDVFNVTKVGKVAGCYVTDGDVKRGAGVRLLRDNVVIHEGKLKTLKRFKDEVKEVKSGYECGMAFENYDDIKVGDMIECFEVEEISRSVGE